MKQKEIIFLNCLTLKIILILVNICILNVGSNILVWLYLLQVKSLGYFVEIILIGNKDRKVLILVYKVPTLTSRM